MHQWCCWRLHLKQSFKLVFDSNEQMQTFGQIVKQVWGVSGTVGAGRMDEVSISLQSCILIKFSLLLYLLSLVWFPLSTILITSSESTKQRELNPVRVSVVISNVPKNRSFNQSERFLNLIVGFWEIRFLHFLCAAAAVSKWSVLLFCSFWALCVAWRPPPPSPRTRDYVQHQHSYVFTECMSLTFSLSFSVSGQMTTQTPASTNVKCKQM